VCDGLSAKVRTHRNIKRKREERKCIGTAKSLQNSPRFSARQPAAWESVVFRFHLFPFFGILPKAFPVDDRPGNASFFRVFSKNESLKSADARRRPSAIANPSRPTQRPAVLSEADLE